MVITYFFAGSPINLMLKFTGVTEVNCSVDINLLSVL